MTEVILSYPKPHEGQAEVLASQARFRLICAGRRWGKDVLLTRRATKKAARGQIVGWFAPTYRMLSENWRAACDVLYPVIKRRNEQEKRLDLTTGGVLEFWSLDTPDSARGRRYHHVVINEAAMVRDLENAWNMVIRPTLADFTGSADFGSTPRGLNYFYTLWQSADKGEWARFRYATVDNPFIPPAEVDAMRAALPERVYRQEIAAEFVADGSYFQRVDDAAIIEQPDTPNQHSGHDCVMGADWALSEDFSVFVVVCRDCGRVVDWWRGNQIDYTYQRQTLINLANKWAVSGVLPERNSIGLPNIELIRDSVSVLYGSDNTPGFNMTASSKPGLIQDLASAIETGVYKVPTIAADELRSFEVMTTGGSPKFSAPSGQHDDWVIALALAWRAASSAKLQLWI